MARTFNGSSDNIDLGNGSSGPIFNITNAVSLSFWMYPAATPNANKYYTPVSKGYDGTHQPFGCAYQNDSNTGSVPGLLFNVNAAGPFCVYQNTFTLNTYVQCVLTYDNTNARIYVNGSLVAGPTAITSASATSSKKCYIGAVDLNGTLGRYFSGRLADVAIWNTGLTALEATSLANGTRPWALRGDGSLKAYFPLDGIGSVDADLSGNAVAPTINGTSGGYNPPHTQLTPRSRTIFSLASQTTTFRRTFSPIGTRSGSRQRIAG